MEQVSGPEDTKYGDVSRSQLWLCLVSLSAGSEWKAVAISWKTECLTGVGRVHKQK